MNANRLEIVRLKPRPAFWKMASIAVALVLVVFTRNVDFYNRTQIAAVKLANGLADILAIETMTSLPIDRKVAMALALIPRAEIKYIQSGQQRIVVNAKRPNQKFN